MMKFIVSLLLTLIPFSTQIPSLQPVETFVSIGETRLFCRTSGKGSPLIVIHGGPGLSQDYLLPYMNKLAERHFVIFYDQRGCGKSTGTINADTINIATFINDLDAIRKQYKLDKVSILGHSWGGYLAMEYAIAHPDHVDKLILSNTLPCSSEDIALFVQEWERRMAPFQKEFQELSSSSAFQEVNPEIVERWYRLMFRTYCYSPKKADLLNLRLTKAAAHRGNEVFNLINENHLCHPFNLHNFLKQLNISTLVIHGDADPIPFSTAEKIHQSIKGSRFVLLKNCGHFPYVEDPDTYFEHVNRFLE